MYRTCLAAAALFALTTGCAIQPPKDGPLMAEGDKRECVTGRTICRKPDANTISEVRTVSGEAARSSSSPNPNPGPAPGRGN